MQEAVKTGRPSALSPDEEALLIACFIERDRLKRELDQLTNLSLAEKFGIGETGVYSRWKRYQAERNSK